MPTRWPTKHSRLYNLAEWRKFLRPFILSRDPMCKMPPPLSRCGGRNPSTVADHIRDHGGDHALFFDAANLRGVCAQCHNYRTNKDHNPNPGRDLTQGAPPLSLSSPVVYTPKDYRSMVR